MPILSGKKKEETITIREIENGWIIQTSSVDDDGNFQVRERFSESEPTIEIDE